jgi:hypothetical protein
MKSVSLHQVVCTCDGCTSKPFNSTAHTPSIAASAARAAPHVPNVITQLCHQAGVAPRPDGKLPVAAFDRFAKMANWSIDRRMVFKDAYRQFMA